MQERDHVLLNCFISALYIEKVDTALGSKKRKSAKVVFLVNRYLTSPFAETGSVERIPDLSRCSFSGSDNCPGDLDRSSCGVEADTDRFPRARLVVDVDTLERSFTNLPDFASINYLVHFVWFREDRHYFAWLRPEARIVVLDNLLKNNNCRGPSNLCLLQREC
eukprot:1455958-Amphidinium_carterae.4